VTDEITSLQATIERYRRLLRSITDEALIAEVERLLAAAREGLAELVGEETKPA